MQDIPRDIQDWTLISSRRYLRRILSNTSNREDALRPFIVHRQVENNATEQVSETSSPLQSATVDDNNVEVNQIKLN